MSLTGKVHFYFSPRFPVIIFFGDLRTRINEQIPKTGYSREIIDFWYGEITTAVRIRPPKKQSEKKKNARGL